MTYWNGTRKQALVDLIENIWDLLPKFLQGWSLRLTGATWCRWKGHEATGSGAIRYCSRCYGDMV